mgnify:CR=1 FL=1
MTDSANLAAWLQATLIFRGLSSTQGQALTQIAQLQTFNKGEQIFRQGQDAVGFFVVKTGRIKVFQMSNNGKEQILNIFAEGENFADVPALDGQAFPASAAALEPTELIFFPRHPFLNLLRQQPDVAIHMLISLSSHLRHLVELVEQLSFKSVPQRLAVYLLSLRHRVTPSNPTVDTLRDTSPASKPTYSSVVYLDLTKSQLAARLGTISATLSRAFYQLSSDGIITIVGPKVTILDCDRLVALSQSPKSPD